MSDSFNGYHVWLGIPPSEQPPNHYRLLGIAIFETDLDVIDHAADRQMAHVRTFQSGRNGGLSQQILNELASARVCLLNLQRKSEYDDSLRAKLSSLSQATAVPMAIAVPMAQPAIATPVLAQPTANQAVAPAKALPGAANPSRSGIYAMPPGSQSPAARAAQPAPGSMSGSSANLGGVAPVKPTGSPVKPTGAAPVKLAGASPPPRPATTATPAGAGAPAGTGKLADDDDPYGLSIASRRPLASRNLADDDDDDDDDDDLAIRHKVGGGVDLSLRSGNRDALIQKLAVYGFICVAVLVVTLVTKNVVERNYGPIQELFNQPTVEHPVSNEPKPIHAPAAPLPAPAAGEIVDEAADPNAADPNASDATGGESNVVGEGKDSIPSVQSPSDLEAPGDLEAPADPSEPQLEGIPATPSGL